MKKKLRLLLSLLALVCLLCVSVHAEEPVVIEQTCTGIIQNGGFPEAPQSGLRLYASAQSADDPLAGVKAALKQGLEALQTEIDISQYKIQKDAIGSIYEQVINENPELFYAGNRYGYNLNGNETVYKFFPYYKADEKEVNQLTDEQKAQIKQQRGELETVVDNILAQVDSDWSPLEKALYLHDYLAAHAQYDTGLEIRDAYTILVKGTGVCQAYTLAYRLLLNRVGISSETVSSESMKHIWNLVQIGDNWYHVDVTWDDPINDRIGRVRHVYFLLSEEMLKTTQDGAHFDEPDWVYSADAATGTYFDNSYWAKVDSAYVPLNDNWYYLSYLSYGNSKLMRTEDPEKVGSQEKAIDAVWWTRSGGGFWPGQFSGLSGYQNKLIYNTSDTIYRYDPESGETEKLHTLTAEEREVGDIYGSVVFGDVLNYTLLETPNEKWTQLYTLELDPYKAVQEDGYAYSIQGGKLSLKPLSAQPSGSVIAAWYDKDGRMLGAIRMETQALTVSLPEAAVTVKLFAVSQTGNIPLCKAAELSTK